MFNECGDECWRRIGVKKRSRQVLRTVPYRVRLGPCRSVSLALPHFSTKSVPAFSTLSKAPYCMVPRWPASLVAVRLLVALSSTCVSTLDCHRISRHL
jgi:hypothetical protein